MLIPTVIEKGHPVDHAYDIYSCLLKERIIFCTKPIDDTLASSITAQLLYLDSLNHNPIQLVINSPGGSVSAGLAMIDTMNFIQSDVVTICMGMCASMAAIILMCGKKGKRCALKNSWIMMHQPLGQISGKTSDLESAAHHFIRTKQQLIQLIHISTGKSEEIISKDIENDTYFTADEALKYGIIDQIISEKIY